MAERSACSSCGAPIFWARTESGAWMPLEVLEQEFAVPTLVVFNPQSGVARVLSGSDVGFVEGWRERGATMHRSHWATCPTATQHRVSDDQLSLLGGKR